MSGWLHAGNIRTEYPFLGDAVESKNLGGQALLQAHFGRDLDCTVTSLAFIFGGASCYSAAEEIAKKHGYNGDTYGTNPLAVKSIMTACLRRFKLAGKAKSAYGKSVGWNYNTIRRLVNGGHYAVLNIWRDGRRYYDSHTVTVVGYESYRKHRFLLVYDNWHDKVSYVDYDKLGVIASINWYE